MPGAFDSMTPEEFNALIRQQEQGLGSPNGAFGEAELMPNQIDPNVDPSGMLQNLPHQIDPNLDPNEMFQNLPNQIPEEESDPMDLIQLLAQQGGPSVADAAGGGNGLQQGESGMFVPRPQPARKPLPEYRADPIGAFIADERDREVYEEILKGGGY